MRATSDRVRGGWRQIAGLCWWLQVVAVLAVQARAEGRVTVCVHQDPMVLWETLNSAERLASKVFTDAGVRIRWCTGRATSDAISVEFSERTPAGYHPGAMAFALPYEGVHIVVFYDRISKNFSADLAPAVLGHVLVHEITHLLQGIDRHSETGIMKAHWTSSDFARMAVRPLAFTAEDIELIQSGLAARVRAQVRMVATTSEARAAVF